MKTSLPRSDSPALRLIAWAMVSALVMMPSLAAAQSKAAPATTPTSSAAPPQAPADDPATWFAKGSAAHEAGKYAEAEELFLKVWAVKKAWDVAANLGLAQVNLGKHVAAAENLSYALRWFPASEPEATRGVLERRLAAARAEVGALQLTVNVEGARVRVDDQMKGTTPLDGELFVAPGSVTIEVTKDGYAPERRTIAVTKGKTEALEVALTPRRGSERSPLPGYVAGGAGIVSLVAGGVLFGLFKAGEADVRDHMPRDADGKPLCERPPATSAARPECAELEAKTSEANTFGNTSIALFAIGGVAVAGAAAYLLWPNAKPSGAAMRVAPFASRDGGGFVWTGSF